MTHIPGAEEAPTARLQYPTSRSRRDEFHLAGASSRASLAEYTEGVLTPSVRVADVEIFYLFLRQLYLDVHACEGTDSMQSRARCTWDKLNKFSEATAVPRDDTTTVHVSDINPSQSGATLCCVCVLILNSSGASRPGVHTSHRYITLPNLR